MKLRNKKTGEIGELYFEPNKEYHFVVATEDPADTMIFKTLTRLNEEWEDYEEPTEIWYIDWKGDIRSADFGNEWSGEKSIGNYFETKEEAEKAVEKLKAWKRLKDKGFRFADFRKLNDCATIIRATHDESWGEIFDDLDICFGGEE